MEQPDQGLVEAALGPLAAVQAVGDREHDPVAGPGAAPEVAVEHQFVRFVLADELEVVLRLHTELRDQRVVYCPRDGLEVLARLAAGQ